MYEIYRDRTYRGDFRVVYYTELGEHNRDLEINRALAGDHFHDGFIREWRKREAKAVIRRFVERLNAGERLAPDELETALAELEPV
jgi:hypothetical protein